MQNFSLASIKNSLDEVRAQVYPRNETEKKVYEALSSKNWGASSTLLNEIATDSNDYEKYGIMSNIIWASLDTDGKSWKQIFKTLTLIDFLIKNGSERFIESSRDKLYKIRTLQDFNYYEGTVDKGSGVREKAKLLVEMLGNNDIIRSEREKARQLRNKFVGIDSRNAGGGGGGYGGSYDNNSNNSYGGNNGGRYGDSGGNNGGRYGDSGGSGGGRYGDSGGGNRYGGDSYDSNSRYGDKGIDSNPHQSGSDSRYGNNNNDSRFGGGSYDSNRPPRYGDDAPESFENAEEDDNKAFRSAPVTKRTSVSASTTATSGTGKLKINIKKEPAVAAKKSAPAPEVDLFGDSGEVDFMSAGGPVAATASNDLFDAFVSAPAAPSTNNFDPFGTSAPVPPSNNQQLAFDPFSTPSVPQQQNHFAAPPPVPVQQFDPFATAPAVQNNTNNNYQSHAPVYQQQQQQQQQQPNAYQNNTFVSPQQQYQQSHQQAFPVQQQQSVPSNLNRTLSSNQDADFGDFEAAPVQAASKPTAPAAANKWGDLGKLVDLSGIGKNEVSAKPSGSSAASNSYQQSAFAGLDGFSKTPQNMQSNVNRPLNYNSSGPMGTAGGNAMLRPAQPPMGGAPMGAPMGGGMGGMGGGGGFGPGTMGGNGYGGGGGFQQAPAMYGQPQQQQPHLYQGGGGMMMGQGGGSMQPMGQGGYNMQQQQQGGGMMMGGGGGYSQQQPQYGMGNRNPNGGYGF